MEKLKHTNGPFVIKFFDESQSVLLPITKEDRQPLIAVVSMRPDGAGNCVLLSIAPTAPHFCADPQCPGEINRRKLEAAEELAKVCREIKDHVDFKMSMLPGRPKPLYDKLVIAFDSWEKAGKGNNGS